MEIGISSCHIRVSPTAPHAVLLLTSCSSHAQHVGQDACCGVPDRHRHHHAIGAPTWGGAWDCPDAQNAKDPGACFVNQTVHALRRCAAMRACVYKRLTSRNIDQIQDGKSTFPHHVMVPIKQHIVNLHFVVALVEPISLLTLPPNS